MVGSVKANVPMTEAEPPVRSESDNGWPCIISRAAGHSVTVGMIFFTVTFTVPGTLL